MVKRIALLAAPLLLAGCLSHPPPPAAPYHAVGKDAGWHLIIDDRNVTFIPAGRQPIVQPRPEPIIGIAGDIYQTPRINVNIVHGRCMIGERSYPDMVQAYVDGTLHTGCGGDPAQASDADEGIQLTGTRWRVALVNGRPTPAVGDFAMQFEAGGDFGARFGCNHMGGRYAMAGSKLVVSDVATTLMGCPEPAATFEQQAGLIFRAPMEMEIAEGGRLVLSNAAGSISLTPVA